MSARAREKPLGFIGTGHIASAMVEGMAGQPGWSRPILLSPRNPARAARLAQSFACVRVAETNQHVLSQCDPLVLALRPQDAETGLSGLVFRADQTVISLMAMVPMAALERLVAPAHRLIRMVPLPGIAKRQGPIVAFPEDPEVRALFAPLGDLIAVESETALHALWALTGLAAPFYAFLSSVQDWGAAHGASPEAAGIYARDFFRSLIAGPGVDFKALAGSVQTRGGLNEAALRRLEGEGWLAALAPVLDDILARLESGPRPSTKETADG